MLSIEELNRLTKDHLIQLVIYKSQEIERQRRLISDLKKGLDEIELLLKETKK